MNSVNIIGRITADPELYQTSNNRPYTAINIAISRGKDSEGNELGADFPRVYIYGKTAENVCKYLSKGRQIGVIGKIRTGSYEKDGQTYYTTDVVADRVEFLGSSSNNSNGSSNSQQSQAPDQSQDVPTGFEALDEEIPF